MIPCPGYLHINQRKMCDIKRVGDLSEKLADGYGRFPVTLLPAPIATIKGNIISTQKAS